MKLTESMLRSIIREELSTMLELDEASSKEEREQERKKKRAAELRKHRPKPGQGFTPRDIYDTDDPMNTLGKTRFNPEYSRDGN